MLYMHKERKRGGTETESKTESAKESDLVSVVVKEREIEMGGTGCVSDEGALGQVGCAIVEGWLRDLNVDVSVSMCFFEGEEEKETVCMCSQSLVTV